MKKSICLCLFLVFVICSDVMCKNALNKFPIIPASVAPKPLKTLVKKECSLEFLSNLSCQHSKSENKFFQLDKCLNYELPRFAKKQHLKSANTIFTVKNAIAAIDNLNRNKKVIEAPISTDAAKKDIRYIEHKINLMLFFSPVSECPLIPEQLKHKIVKFKRILDDVNGDKKKKKEYLEVMEGFFRKMSFYLKDVKVEEDNFQCGDGVSKAAEYFINFVKEFLENHNKNKFYRKNKN